MTRSDWSSDSLPYGADVYDVRGAYRQLEAWRPYILLLDAAYVLFVWKVAPKIRKLRTDPRLLRDLSIIWNAFNAVTSMYMFVLLLPELISSLGNGWYHTTCKVGTFYTGQWSGHSMYLFCLSKLWELGDTILLVLRGRQLLFLHYFHHSVVLIQVIFTYYSAGSMARLGTDMNSFVHSLMYSYFALVNVVPSIRRFAPIITCLQISQFVVACIGMLSLAGYVMAGYECETNKMALPLHFAIYVIFFGLFTQFFVDSYGTKKGSERQRPGRSLRAKKRV